MKEEIETGVQVIRELGSFGVIVYGIIRSLRIAESISAAIIEAFKGQTEALSDIHKKIDTGFHNIAARINEAEVNISRGVSGEAPFRKRLGSSSEGR